MAMPRRFLNSEGGKMSTLFSILTNQYFLLFITIATGLLVGKIKIKNFSLGISAPIFTGILIGWVVTEFANHTVEGSAGYSAAQKLLSNGLVPSGFSTFFLLLFLVSTGLMAGKSIKNTLKRYGIRFVVIGICIPVVTMLLTILLHSLFLSGNGITSYASSGMFAGSMTSTPAYGTSEDIINALDISELYKNASADKKQKVLDVIGDETLTLENTQYLTEEQVVILQENAQSDLSFAYSLSFPIGVLVIVLMISFIPKIFNIDIEKEKELYEQDIINVDISSKEIPEQKSNFMSIAIVVCIGIALGSIEIPVGSSSFSLGSAGGTLIVAMLFSYIGKIGPFNFRIKNETLTILYQMGIIFFMAVTGLSNGYNVIHSLSEGNGIILVIATVVIEFIAILIAFFIGRKLFHLNWTILSGSIAGGCTSAPGLGAAISTIGNDVPTTGYGASQPFAILSNVLMIMLFFKLFFV